MATASNLTLNYDATNSDVFKPQVKREGHVSYVSHDEDIAAASKRVESDFKPITAARPVQRVKQTLSFPLKRSDGGSPAVYTASNVARFIGEWVLPDSMSDAEKLEFDYQVESLIAEATMRLARRESDPPS